MNDPSFLERLNLLIDGELPEVRRAEVLREIASDPAKLRLYRQYRRLQAASQAAFESFRSTAALPRVDGNVIWIPRTLQAARRSTSAGYLRLAATAAACALAVLGPSLLLDHVREPIAQAGSLHVASAPMPAPAPRVADFGSSPLSVDVPLLPRPDAERFERGSWGQRWTPTVSASPFTVELVVDSQYGAAASRPVFVNGVPASVPARMASFTFQR